LAFWRFGVLASGSRRDRLPFLVIHSHEVSLDTLNRLDLPLLVIGTPATHAAIIAE